MEVDAAACLLRYFKQVTDPRASNVSHLLSDILAITLMAVLSRCDDWEEIEAWGQAHEAWLRTFLALAHGIPSHDTFERLFARLKAWSTMSTVTPTPGMGGSRSVDAGSRTK